MFKCFHVYMMIVLYGVNNLGKTTQAKKLVERLHAESYSAEYIKYPIYDLEPSGPRLNAYLRRENPEHLTPEQAQLLYIENRTAYEPTLKAKLAAGVHIVAEDYTGTGIAWGVTKGAMLEVLEQIKKFVESDVPEIGMIGQLSKFDHLVHGYQITGKRVYRWKNEPDKRLLAEAQEVFDNLKDYCKFWDYTR